MLEVGGQILKTSLEPICCDTLFIYNQQNNWKNAVVLVDKKGSSFSK